MLWLVIIPISIIWVLGLLYLLLVVYYRLSRKEIFVPFIPADKRGIDMMCEAVGLQGTESVVDVGSGWGSIVFHLLDTYPRLAVTGIELNPLLYLLSMLRKTIFYPNRNIKLCRGDAEKFSYKNFDVVFLFMLSPFVNKVLAPKLETELRIGAQVVSYVFRMKSNKFKETRVKLLEHGWKSAVYVYEKIV
ncbi:class I SAM-dependent methyltransferase [bacterium]|nr:class I SAM-dependent methyltransferase [bacterium]